MIPKLQKFYLKSKSSNKKLKTKVTLNSSRNRSINKK